MPETRSHREAKTKAAGTSGKVEVRIKENRRLDAVTAVRAVEVERSGDNGRLRDAATKLKDSGKRQLVLIVPQRDMMKAQKAMREVGLTGTVKNLKGTKSEYVGARTTRAPTPKGSAHRSKAR